MKSNKNYKPLSEPAYVLYLIFMALFALASLYFRQYFLAAAEGAVTLVLAIVAIVSRRRKNKQLSAYIESIMNYGVELQPVRDRYIEYDSPSGNKVTLNADGTGYLYLGDDNQGPVSSWSLDGTALKLSAGVSDFDGTIDNGLMTLVFDDGFSLVFVAPGTDVSSLKPISIRPRLRRRDHGHRRDGPDLGAGP